MAERKIAVTSDSHWHECQMPEADFFIHCGDMTGHGYFHETAGFADRLNKSSYRGGVIVPGNHDRIFEVDFWAVCGLFDARFKVLVDQEYTWEGLRFYGSPWTPPFKRWSFMKTEEQLARVFAGIPQELDFLVTHGPAAGILDNGLGSDALRTAVDSRQIGRHVFGHIHEEGGRSLRSGDRWSHNVSACNLKYEQVNPAMVFEV